MSERQALIRDLREAAIVADPAMLLPQYAALFERAATALEEAQGVPREPTPLERAVAQNRRVLGLPPQRHAAAPAAPTREPVSAATPRDEQDARRYRFLRDGLNPATGLHRADLIYLQHLHGRALDERIDAGLAALAEPKR